MLNYNKITTDIEGNKRATNRFMGELLGITESTFRSRRDLKNFTPNDIEKIADYFGRSILYYYDRDEATQKGESYNQQPKTTLINDEYKTCRLCKEKDKQIEIMGKYIALLEGQGRNRQATSG